MKAIMVSIRPKWVAKILNGEKTIEIRKKFPKDYVGWVYIYVTKGKETLSFDTISKNDKTCYDGFNDKDFDFHFFTITKSDINKGWGWYASERNLNGKVVARFWCDKVERLYEYQVDGYGSEYEIASDTLKQEELLKECCLTYDQLSDYLGDINNGYAIHITKLEIFDKPKEISEFFVFIHIADGLDVRNQPKRFKIFKHITRPPQSWCYVEI